MPRILSSTRPKTEGSVHEHTEDLPRFTRFTDCGLDVDNTLITSGLLLEGLLIYLIVALTKEKKKEVVEDVKNITQSSGSVVFVRFHGLSVEAANELRSELRGEEVQFRVTKKTLTERALDEMSIEGDRPRLDGELALAFSADNLSAAREIYNQQKKRDEAVAILGGIFDGVYKTQEEMTALAQIPPLDTLRGMFVNLINSPIARSVVALNQIAEKKA